MFNAFDKKIIAAANEVVNSDKQDKSDEADGEAEALVQSAAAAVRVQWAAAVCSSAGLAAAGG